MGINQFTNSLDSFHSTGTSTTTWLVDGVLPLWANVWILTRSTTEVALSIQVRVGHLDQVSSLLRNHVDGILDATIRNDGEDISIHDPQLLDPMHLHIPVNDTLLDGLTETTGPAWAKAGLAPLEDHLVHGLVASTGHRPRVVGRRASNECGSTPKPAYHALSYNQLNALPLALFCFAISRSIFIPLYILCNIGGNGAIVKNDVFYFVVMQLLFGLTSGHIGSNCMMAIPEWFKEKEREAAGGYMGLCLAQA